jgi:hypothetical protein
MGDPGDLVGQGLTFLWVLGACACRDAAEEQEEVAAR